MFGFEDGSLPYTVLFEGKSSNDCAVKRTWFDDRKCDTENSDTDSFAEENIHLDRLGGLTSSYICKCVF